MRAIGRANYDSATLVRPQASKNLLLMMSKSELGARRVLMATGQKKAV
jgi:hypothetical protein